LQWLEDSSQSSGDNFNTVRRETSRHYRNKIKEYLKGKINQSGTHGKNMNIRDLCRGINEFKKGYEPRASLVKDEKGDLFVDSHSIVNSGSIFCQF
jgi:hypothetical protein